MYTTTKSIAPSSPSCSLQQCALHSEPPVASSRAQHATHRPRTTVRSSVLVGASSEWAETRLHRWRCLIRYAPSKTKGHLWSKPSHLTQSQWCLSSIHSLPPSCSDTPAITGSIRQPNPLVLSWKHGAVWPECWCEARAEKLGGVSGGEDDAEESYCDAGQAKGLGVYEDGRRTVAPLLLEGQDLWTGGRCACVGARGPRVLVTDTRSTFSLVKGPQSLGPRSCEPLTKENTQTVCCSRLCASAFEAILFRSHI